MVAMGGGSVSEDSFQALSLKARADFHFYVASWQSKVSNYSLYATINNNKKAT